MFRKIGENISFDVNTDILEPKQALVNEEITKNFIKLSKKLRRVAPRANDFLFVHCIAMHAAEAALIDQKTGETIKNAKGESVKGYFEKFINKKGQEAVRWVSPDGIKPYRNGNCDIFPEEELMKSYKLFCSKPICQNHESDSVNGIRGLILDTHYDKKFKRIHALFALDKKNYGELARKVETGYANCVSMGCGVLKSCCAECGNVATTEKEYCDCVKSRKSYGEFNLGLNPLEISLVVNGADPLAKVRNIIASMNNYVEQKQEYINNLVQDRCVNPIELKNLAESVGEVQKKLNNLIGIEKSAFTSTSARDLGEVAKAIDVLQKQITMEADEEKKSKLQSKIDSLVEEINVPAKPTPPLPATGGGSEPSFSGAGQSDERADYKGYLEPSELRLANIKEGDKQGAISKELSLLRSKVEKLGKSFSKLNSILKEDNSMNSARLRARAKARRAYWLGGGGLNDPSSLPYKKEDADSIRDKEDKQMVGEPIDTGSEGLHPGDKEKLRDAGRNGMNLSKAELEDRKLKRRAYFQGGGGLNEPTPGDVKYPKEDADSIRDKEDKQMQTKDLGGTDGMVPGDEKVKELMLRAKLRARFTKVADTKGSIRKDASKWDIFAGDKLILTATGSEIYGDELNENWDYLSSAKYGKDVIKYIRDEGFDRVAYLLKGAQPPAAPELPKVDVPAPGAEPMPELPAPEKADKPAKDDSKGKIDEALNKMEEALAELRDVAGGAGDELVNVDVSTEGKKDVVPEGGPLDATLASRKDLMNVIAMMDESADELALVSELFESGKVNAKVVNAASQALQDSELILANASLIIDAKKGKGKVKKDKKEDKKEDKKDKDEKKEDKKEDEKKEDKKDEKDDEKKEDKKDEKKEDKEDKKEDKKDEKDDKDEKDEKEAKAMLEQALKVRAENRALAADEGKFCTHCGHEKGMSAADGGCNCADCADCLDMNVDQMVEESDSSLLEARKAARENLIAKASDKLNYPQIHDKPLDLGTADNTTEPTFFQAHPKGGTVTELTGTKTPEAKVETIEEIHEVMRDVAESGPRNVREAAAILQEKIVEGSVKASDVDRLVAEGKADKTVVDYWKKFWAQAPDAGSFGADMSKEFANKKKEASADTQMIKLRRAYDLGLQAQEKGLIGLTKTALDTYVDEVLKFDDAAFESVKRIVAKTNTPAKKNVSLPRVGGDAANEPMNVTASKESDPAPDLASQLSILFRK